MPDRCVIIGSAAQNADVLKNIVKNDDYIICADGGYSACKEAGYAPDLFVGDIDSSISPEDTIKIVLPAEKDMTDLQAAINEGIKRGFKEFILTGCTGKRLDHHYAAVCMLEYLNTQGVSGRIIDTWNMIFFHKGGAREFVKIPEYKYISVVPLDEKLTGVWLKGLKYPLKDAVLLRTGTVGVSNEFEDNKAVIEVGSGRSLVIYSKD